MKLRRGFSAFSEVLATALLLTRSKQKDLYTAWVNTPLLWRQNDGCARGSGVLHHPPHCIGTHTLPNLQFFLVKFLASSGIFILQ